MPSADQINFFAAFINHIAESKLWQALAIFASLASLVFSTYISVKAYKINRIIKFNETARLYNARRYTYFKIFRGHRTSILKDDLKTDLILKNILEDVEGYAFEFKPLLGYFDIFHLYLFKRQLKKDATKADFNIICNYLARFSGKTRRREDEKNG